MPTKIQYELVQDVSQGNISSAYVVAPFHKGLRLLQRNKYNLISLEENAQLRMQEGFNAYISRNGNWVKEDVIYKSGVGHYLTKNAPINDDPERAASTFGPGGYFYLDKDQWEYALDDAVALNRKPIPTNKFGENEITKFAFGEQAENYGLFLRDRGIREMLVQLKDHGHGNRATTQKIWFRGFDDRCELGSGDNKLHNSHQVRGVGLKIGEVTQRNSGKEKNSRESYTLSQISDALKNLKTSGKSLKISELENLLFNELRKDNFYL